MPSPLFYLFAAIMLIGGTMVVFMRNPVSSALSMVLSFLGLAALFVGLNAYLIGILQILVYAGAIMVLFIFIIMLLDLKKEEKTNLVPTQTPARSSPQAKLAMHGALGIENHMCTPIHTHIGPSVSCAYTLHTYGNLLVLPSS